MVICLPRSWGIGWFESQTLRFKMASGLLDHTRALSPLKGILFEEKLCPRACQRFKGCRLPPETSLGQRRVSHRESQAVLMPDLEGQIHCDSFKYVENRARSENTVCTFRGWWNVVAYGDYLLS